MSPGSIVETVPVQVPDHGVVGPNAVLQLIKPLREATGEDGLHAVFARAGLLHYLSQAPASMVPEQQAERLFRAVLDTLPPATAKVILSNAGRGTAEYIMANRIPGAARSLLKLLPPALAAPLLCKAIEQHAWTFAGTGNCRTTGGRVSRIEIHNNPLATPGCPWHSAVIQTLFQTLVDRRLGLRHDACCADGGTVCSFELGRQHS